MALYNQKAELKSTICDAWRVFSPREVRNFINAALALINTTEAQLVYNISITLKNLFHSYNFSPEAYPVKIQFIILQK